MTDHNAASSSSGESLLWAVDKLCKVRFLSIAEIRTSRSIVQSGLELAIRCFAAYSDPGNECLADKAALVLNLRNNRSQPKADMTILHMGGF